MRKLTTLLMFFLFSVAQVWAQSRTVTGKVTDEKGNAVEGATVKAIGSVKGTSTGKDGSFSLSVPANAKQLTISGVGLTTKNVTIPSSGSVSVSLASSSSDLEEVLVQVPYGTVKKTAFTGSEGTVSGKQIEKQQQVSFTKALDGMIAGVSTSNGGGEPGSSSSIRIRGIASIGSGNDPLYVLNGVPYDGDIASINPDDIESITILKDAASAALYGSRGAGGVIMLTTKKGKKGKAQISVKATQGFINRGIPEYDRLNQKQYYEMMWEATKNSFINASGMSASAAAVAASQQLTDGSHLVYNAYNVPGNQLIDPTTGKLNPNAQLLWNEPWDKALFRTAQRQNVNTTISGASNGTDYLISAGYLNEQGTEVNTGFKRYNMRLNVNTEANSWLKAGLNIDGAVTKNVNVTNGGSATSNPFYFTRQLAPIYPIYQHDLTTGAIVRDASGNPVYDFGIPSQMGSRPGSANSNIIASLALDDIHSVNFNGNVNSYLDFKLSKHLSLKTTFGLNTYNSYGTQYQNNQYGDALNVKGRSTKSEYTQISYTLNEVLNWTQSFGKHNFNVLAGHENYYLQADQSYATKTGFAFAGQSQLDAGTTNEGSGSSQDNERIEGFFGRLQYDYNNRYIISGSFRRDGDSRFHPNERWGNFWSIGGGWRISEESFMKKYSWINELKLKADYGSLGNSTVLNSDGSQRYYAYQSYYLGGFPNAGFSGNVADVTGSNPALKWESVFGSNFGVDFTLFNRRLQGSIEYFEKGSNGMILNVPGPPSTALVTTPANVGNMTNKGWEFQLGYNAIVKKNFDWRVDVNFTTYKNEIGSLPNFPSSQYISGGYIYKVGLPIYSFYTREFAGVDAATGDALYSKNVKDASGKPTGAKTVTTDATLADLYTFGTSLPKWSGGLTNTVRYKNYELTVLTTFSYGGLFSDGNYSGLMSNGIYGTAWHTDILSAWKKPGDITNVPRVQNGLSDNGSSRFLFDRSYLNIKNIALTYSLPKATASKLHLVGLSVFGNIDNVALFTVKKGMDPQRNFSGTSNATYPPVRTITFGINVNL